MKENKPLIIFVGIIGLALLWFIITQPHLALIIFFLLTVLSLIGSNFE